MNEKQHQWKGNYWYIACRDEKVSAIEWKRAAEQVKYKNLQASPREEEVLAITEEQQ
jgi:hypothetical protein